MGRCFVVKYWRDPRDEFGVPCCRYMALVAVEGPPVSLTQWGWGWCAIISRCYYWTSLTIIYWCHCLGVDKSTKGLVYCLLTLSSQVKWHGERSISPIAPREYLKWLLVIMTKCYLPSLFNPRKTGEGALFQSPRGFSIFKIYIAINLDIFGPPCPKPAFSQRNQSNGYALTTIQKLLRKTENY